jgi:transcriptional regulator with XRE-family HTH domain
MSDPEKSRFNAGRPREYDPVSPEAERVGNEVRKARGVLPLKKVAEDLDISHQALSKIESGRTNPEDPRAKRTLRRLAEYLGSAFGLDWLRPHLQPSPVLKMARPGKESKATRRGLTITPKPSIDSMLAGLLDKKSLKEMPDEDVYHYLHVVKDALERIQVLIEAEARRRKR